MLAGIFYCSHVVSGIHYLSPVLDSCYRVLHYICLSIYFNLKITQTSEIIYNIVLCNMNSKQWKGMKRLGKRIGRKCGRWEGKR